MNWLVIASFLFFIGILSFASWYKLRRNKLKTVNSLFMADRSLSFLLVGGGLLFTNINTATIIGENELSYTHNMSVMAWGITSVLAMLIVSEFLMPLYLKLGIATTPDYLTARYGQGMGKLVSIIFLISYIINLLPSVLYSGAVAFNGLFHFSEILKTDYWTIIWILIWVMGTIGCLYAILGGMRAIAISDTLLGLGIFAGGLLLPIFALRYLGNGSILLGLHTVLNVHTQHLNSIGSSSDPIPFSTLFTGMLLVNLYYWGTEQYIVQQVLASKDLKNSQKGIAVACFGKLISPLLLNVPGLIAVHIFTNMHNPTEVFPKLDSLVSPPFIAGYIAAIIFGAALTTFNAGLNSSGTLFVLNIYKPWQEKHSRQVSEKQLIKTAKKFEIIVCLAAMFIAPFIIFVKNGFYTYVQIVNGFFNVPIFTIMFIGFMTKKVPALAAKVGLAFFIITYGLTQLVFDLHIHFLHILAILFVVTCGIMLVIGKLYPMPVPYQQKLNNLVNIEPWKNRHLYSGILLVLMILMFILFSPLILAK
ncbi:solute:sodium symporter family transporter [Mucilaginibacter sabulilitoris]|uniref:Solute:sodium symporter family transporter n=1 Tax=Mucilaginibacter sabulilitoris TaxID=1173583 RepID=A0ABZ0TI99_9SPHI|nr:solute:sodium symporter family transporter [Mucilaginibacter sabulilitoris]WPU91444.1 solute:sodium symporter family transporter [Mucilaginibacter sabulilitoris]